MKKYFVKFFSVIALILSLSFACFGCGKTPPPDTGSSQQQGQSSGSGQQSSGGPQSPENPQTPGGTEPPASHICSFSSTWVTDDEYHWKKCTGCNEITERARHNTGGVCQICYYMQPDDQYLPYFFSGHNSYLYEDLVHTRNSRATGDDDYKTTWYDLAENQINVAAQDILQRLTFIYGTERANTKSELDNSYNRYKFIITDRDRVGVSGYNAYVLPHLLLTDEQEEESLDHEECCDLDCLICLQNQIKTFTTDSTNYLYNENNIHLAEAISGKYTVATGTTLDSTAVADNAWNWYSDSLVGLDYEDYAELYLNNFKMAIAEILSGKQTITGVYDKAAYDDMVNKLVAFNISDYKAEIISFIKNTIIGTDLIAKDNAIKNGTYFTTNGFVIDSTFASLSEGNSPKTYKAYDLIIDSIVSQTFANVYRDYEGESPMNNQKLVYKISKLKGIGSNYLPNGVGEKCYADMTMQPRNNKVPTVLRAIISSSTTNPNKTLNIDIKIVIDGVEYTDTKTVTLTAEEQYFEIDIAGMTNGATFKAYNKNTNYIYLDFNNIECISFDINFLRMMPAE